MWLFSDAQDQTLQISDIEINPPLVLSPWLV